MKTKPKKSVPDAAFHALGARALTRAEQRAQDKANRLALDDARRRCDEELLRRSNLLETTRSGRLLLRQEEHICIASDEPYYMETYRKIRLVARRKGSWTTHCEDDFRARLERWLNREAVTER